MSELYLVTGATAHTGRYAVENLLAAGQRVRAFVHKEDERADELRKLGAEVVVGTSWTSQRCVRQPRV